jgi:hypothetical protein
MRNLLFFLVPFLLFSCGDRELSEDLKNQMVDENQIHDCLAYIANMDYDIESRGERFESLIYTNDFEECKSVLWYLEDTLTVAREITRNLKTNEQHEVSFYFNSGQLYLVQDIANMTTGEGEMSSDEYILLYENGSAVRAWKNVLQDGVFDPYKYEAADLKSYNPARAIDMFTHKKEFVLHFEDFLESQGDLYLLVNTGQKENFIAAIKIDSMDDFLQTLYTDKSKFKNVALDLNHQAVNQGGWTFHYYVSGGFLR